MENISDAVKVETDRPEAQVRAVITLLSSDAGHPQAHNMVLTALRHCTTALESPTEQWLLFLEELLAALPHTAHTLPTLLVAVETGLGICLSLGGTNPHLSHTISALFKTAYSQLKIATGLLDSLVTSDPWLHPTLTALLNVAMAVMNFDPSIVALCWRSLGRGLPKLSSSQQALAGQIVCQLCIALETTYREASGEKGVKLVTFIGNILCQIIREVPVCPVEAVVDCLLTVLNGERLVEQAFALAQGLVSVLAQQRAGLELLLTVPLPCSGHPLGRLLTLCTLIPLLPKLQEELVEFCLEPSNGTCRLLASLFTSLSQSFVWLQLPFCVPGFKLSDRVVQKSVSLSKYVSCSLCLLCTIAPCQYMASIERCLFRAVLSSLPHLALLATDVLVYHVRRCSEVVVRSYLELIQQLLNQVSSQYLTALLYRLKRLLPHSSLPQPVIIPNALTGKEVMDWTEARETVVVMSLLQQCPPNGLSCSQVARTFKHLIASPSWLVHTLALEAFRSLAKVSADTGFVENCVPPGHTEAVLQFLHKRDSGSWSADSVRIGLVQQERSYHAQTLHFILTWTHALTISY